MLREIADHADERVAVKLLVASSANYCMRACGSSHRVVGAARLERGSGRFFAVDAIDFALRSTGSVTIIGTQA